MTTVSDRLYQMGGVPVLPNGVPIPFTGNWWFVDPVNGSDGFDGQSPVSGRAFQTLYRAHAAAKSGNNDVVALIGNGQASGSARLSTALAQAVDSTATSGTLTWSKNALHLVGIAAPGQINGRARIAPPTGTYTQTTFGSGNFVVVSGQGCCFANVSAFNGFSTGGTNQIAWTDSGAHNAYLGTHFLGMGDAASAGDAGSHSLLVTGSGGEHFFGGCTIGLDTVKRSVSGVSELVFAAGSPRNVFKGCNIITYAGDNGDFWVSIGTDGIDRWVLFDGCNFMNPIDGGPAANTMTVGMSIPASPGGAVMMRDCLSYGATKLTASGLAFTNLPAAAASGGLGAAIS